MEEIALGRILKEAGMEEAAMERRCSCRIQGIRANPRTEGTRGSLKLRVPE